MPVLTEWLRIKQLSQQSLLLIYGGQVRKHECYSLDKQTVAELPLSGIGERRLGGTMDQSSGVNSRGQI
jgi:hypothetical protein